MMMSDTAGQGAAFEDSDDSLLVDLSNVKEMSFEVLPKGIYAAIIESVKYEISKNSGKPMWNVQFTVSDGEYANRKLFNYMSFSEKALPGTKANIKRIAPELLSGPFNPKKIADEGYLTGKQVRLKVDVEKYTPEGGEPRDTNRVRDILAAGNIGDGFTS